MIFTFHLNFLTVSELCSQSSVIIKIIEDTKYNLVLEEEKDGSFQVMYSLGDALKESDSSAIEAAISTVYNSKGGRVAVPETHPSAALLPEEHKRCILLQKIDMEANDGKRRCIMVASNQLLAAFTKNDLNWLGCLGAYVGDS